MANQREIPEHTENINEQSFRTLQHTMVLN